MFRPGGAGHLLRPVSDQPSLGCGHFLHWDWEADGECGESSAVHTGGSCWEGMRAPWRWGDRVGGGGVEVSLNPDRLLRGTILQEIDARCMQCESDPLSLYYSRNHLSKKFAILMYDLHIIHLSSIFGCLCMWFHCKILCNPWWISTGGSIRSLISDLVFYRANMHVSECRTQLQTNTMHSSVTSLNNSQLVEGRTAIIVVIWPLLWVQTLIMHSLTYMHACLCMTKTYMTEILATHHILMTHCFCNVVATL